MSETDCPLNAGNVHVNGMCLPGYILSTDVRVWRTVAEFNGG